MKTIIVGAGPVGLYLGCLLRRDGIECTILEQRTVRSTHSRSIGIHPPALGRMEELGLATHLLEEGIPVRRGQGFIDGVLAGVLSFSQLPEPFNMILALPQHRTEALLEELFTEMGGRVERGHEVVSLTESDNTVTVVSRSGPEERRWMADWVIGCDGRHSRIRSLLAIRYKGRAYDDHYVMGDFPDTTGHGADAGIFLDRRGVVECFPLPDGIRRWVARMDRPLVAGTSSMSVLVDLVRERTSVHLDQGTCRMHSSFTAERYEAERFHVGRVALAGDAAHVISPIGGQGMNLGWMDADWLATFLCNDGNDSFPTAYDRHRKRSFRKAARRSELNMFMGRSGPLYGLRRILARVILSPLLQPTFARLFSMKGL